VAHFPHSISIVEVERGQVRRLQFLIAAAAILGITISASLLLHTARVIK
jgi:hypothetical protein